MQDLDKPRCAGAFWGEVRVTISPQVAGAWTERQKMFLGGSFLKLADDDV